jgi:uncharacterized protein
MIHSKIIERKSTALPINYVSTVIETRNTSLLDQRIVEGYGNVWSQKNSHDEKFLKGCWTRSIAENGPTSEAHYKIKFRGRHNNALALFDTLREDDIGLYFKTKPLDDIDEADDMLKQIRSGTINNFSTGFRYNWDKMEYDEETDTLIVKEARLFEISAVDIPSDLQTFAIRSNEPLEMDEIEDFIQSLPKNKQLECRKLISQCLSIKSRESPRNNAEARTSEETTESIYSYLLKNI